MTATCRKKQRWFEVGLIWLFFVTFAGDPPPGVNEPHYLCRLKHFWDQNWAPGDIFLSTREAHYCFTVSLGWLTRVFDLTTVAWIGRGIAWLVLASGWQRLAWQVVPTRFASLLSASLFVTLIEQANFAGEWVVAGGVEAKCFAYAFVFEALAAMLAGKSSLAIILLGISIAWHALAGGWSALVLSLIWLARFGERNRLKQAVPAIIVGLAIAMIGIIPGLRLTAGELAETVAEANRIYVFERLPHHLAPFHLRPAELFNRIERFGILLVMTSLLGLGLWYRLKPASQLSPAESAPSPTRDSLQLVASFAAGSLVIFTVGCLLQVIYFERPLQAAALLKYYWFRLADVAVPLTASLIITSLVSIGVARRHWSGPVLLSLAMLCIGYETFPRVKQRIATATPRADARMLDLDDWIETCRWARENTPRDSRFLTPRNSLSFKWRAGRAEVATWKDIPQDAAGVVMWFQRLTDIYRPSASQFPQLNQQPKRRVRSLTELSPGRIRQLGEKYEFQYLLVEADPPLALPVLFRNDSYSIYQVTTTKPPPADRSIPAKD